MKKSVKFSETVCAINFIAQFCMFFCHYLINNFKLIHKFLYLYRHFEERVKLCRFLFGRVWRVLYVFSVQRGCNIRRRHLRSVANTATKGGTIEDWQMSRCGVFVIRSKQASCQKLYNVVAKQGSAAMSKVHVTLPPTHINS